MAHAAVPQPLYQIGATVPFLRLLRLRLKGTIFEEHRFPETQGPALIVGEAEIILRLRSLHRRDRLKVSVNGRDILIAYEA